MTISHHLQKNSFKPLTLALASIFFCSFSLIIPVAHAADSNVVPTLSSQAPATNAPTSTSGVATGTTATTTVTPTTPVTTPVSVSTPTRATVANAPLTQPNMSDTAVLNWASDAAKSAYSYDFKNYKQQMQALQPY